MAGLLAWAADVVGGNGGERTDEENDPDSIPLILTSEQQTYVQELDRKATSLNRSIQDLRQRLPPPDISQRLPHLHAHSLASNAALALQLNAHSTTKQQKSVSLVNRTATPADEHAAARDSVAITCNHESDFYKPIGRVQDKN
ncbi:unnamed protein product [Fraxinus pennsylvanica]|uniref:Uncharacterized protein n=1 Tax=Fraxinus pennsylvanica TaxID=56036 RepID=A0AAD1ZTM5_9LAMI|nr:unnamed protein product [Fraxinus pennsylvanica]